MLTLWDLLIEPVARRLRPAPPSPTTPPVSPTPAPTRSRSSARKRITLAPSAPHAAPAPDATTRESMDERYERITREMLARFNIRVRRWRKSMSGMAWELHYNDGSRKRMLESPQPRGPMSMAIFLHEVGHHAIGFNRYKPRCLEEYHAWKWSLEAMELHGLNITDAVRRRMHESLWYAVAKARRRGLRELPPELLPYQTRPRRQPRDGAAQALQSQGMSRQSRG